MDGVMAGNEYISQLRAIAQTAMVALDHGEVSSNKLNEAASLLKVVSEALNTARLTAIAHINTLDEIITQLQGLDSNSLTLMQSLGSFELAREKMNQAQQNMLHHIEQIDAHHAVLLVGTISMATKDSKAAFFDGTEKLRDYIHEVQ
jgi:cell division protein ZapA (FtsZ GTPase activity inhibitor)